MGSSLQLVGELLAEAADVRADERVLDVAAGNGNASLAAARRRARVMSTDFVQALLDKGLERARAEGLAMDVRRADAEALPFADASFDVVLSTFGVMFTPDHQRAANELLRVVRPGGRIALANWTPEGLVGRMFRLLGAHVPPPAGVPSPALWGTDAHLMALFGTRASRLQSERRHFNFRYRSAAHFVQVFREVYGPVHQAFARLDDASARALETDLVDLLEAFNRAPGESVVAPGEYLEVVIHAA